MHILRSQAVRWRKTSCGRAETQNATCVCVQTCTRDGSSTASRAQAPAAAPTIMVAAAPALVATAASPWAVTATTAGKRAPKSHRKATSGPSAPVSRARTGGGRRTPSWPGLGRPGQDTLLGLGPDLRRTRVAGRARQQQARTCRWGSPARTAPIARRDRAGQASLQFLTRVFNLTRQPCVALPRYLVGSEMRVWQ